MNVVGIPDDEVTDKLIYLQKLKGLKTHSIYTE